MDPQPHRRKPPNFHDPSPPETNPSQGATPPPTPPPTTKRARRQGWEDDDSETGISLLDILRILGGLLLLSSALSYFITRESLFWNYRPAFTRPGVLRAWLRGPISLTDAELLAYDGTNAALPIYVALNGTIYDVSAAPHMYGPGGSYHFFAGRDATRAFVTGCFAEDLVPDLRGVEEMFVPVDEEEDDEGQGEGGEGSLKGDGKGKGGGLSRAERKLRRERELRVARRKVAESVAHWEGFFGRKGGKYFEVGRVRREEGWLERLPRRELCEAARKSRPKRERDRNM